MMDIFLHMYIIGGVIKGGKYSNSSHLNALDLGMSVYRESSHCIIVSLKTQIRGGGEGGG